MKKLIILLLSVLLVVNAPLTMYGESDGNNNLLKINLDQAYKMIEENNIELKLIDKKIEAKQQQYRDSLDQAQDAEGQRSSNPSVNLQYRKTELLDWQFEKLELDEVKNEREVRLQDLKSDVKKQFMDIQALNKDIAFIEEDIVTLEKKIQEMQLRINLGQAKESDLKSISAQKLTLQNQRNSFNTQIQSKLINLKKTLGIEITKQIGIEEILLPYEAMTKENLEEKIKKAVDNDFSIRKLSKELELKNYEIQLVKDYTDYRYFVDYKDLEVEADEIETQLSFDKLNKEADLWIEYYSLLELQDNIKLEELNLEIEEINNDAVSAKAKLGMVDTITEVNSRIAYNRQKNNYQRAMYNYILAVEQFNEKLNIEE